MVEPDRIVVNANILFSTLLRSDSLFIRRIAQANKTHFVCDSAIAPPSMEEHLESASPPRCGTPCVRSNGTEKQDISAPPRTGRPPPPSLRRGGLVQTRFIIAPRITHG
jgi:hypothetical protein